MKKHFTFLKKIGLQFNQFLFIIGITLCHFSYGQVFKQSFNTLITDYLTSDKAVSKASNHNNQYHNYETNLLDAFLTMYETTHDAVYLDYFVEHAQNVINRRNDNIVSLGLYDLNTDYFPNLPPGFILPSNPLKAWFGGDPGIGNFAQRPELVNNGQITLPLAKFAYFVKVKYPSLQNRNVPTNANVLDPSGCCTMVTQFNHFADLLKTKVDQTCRLYFEQLWNYNNGSYMADVASLSNPNAVQHGTSQSNVNYHSSIGRTLVYMLKIYESENNLSFRDYYWYKVTKLANRFKDPNVADFFRNTSAHIVSWGYSSPINSDPSNYDDVPHALISIEFAELCYIFQIKDYPNNSVLLFDNSFMYDFAHTIYKKVMYAPQKNSLCITGNDNECEEAYSDPNNIPLEGTYQRYGQYNAMGKAVELSKYLPDMYNMFADYFYEASLDGICSTCSPKYLIDLRETMLTTNSISHLALLRDHPSINSCFDIKSVKRDQQYEGENGIDFFTKWSGVTSGRFSKNTNKNSLATISSNSQTFFPTFKIKIHDIEDLTNKIMPNESLFSGNNFPDTWRAISCGNINPETNYDEIVSFNYFTKEICLFERNQVQLDQIDLISSTQTDIDVAAIAVGNFDNQTGDEVIVSNKIDGKIYMFKFNGSTLVQINLSNQSNDGEPACLAVGNLDNNSANGLEIVSVNNNNSNGYNIKIYNINSTTLAFEPVSYSYIGTTGNYSKWDGIAIGDFNGDGCNEFVLHRKYDGDFIFFKFVNSTISTIRREYFPPKWTLESICEYRFQNDFRDNLVSLRSDDGNMFIFEVDKLPTICGEPSEHPHETKNSELNMVESINNISDEMPITLSPNPANELTLLSFITFEELFYQIDLYDSKGIKLLNVFSSQLEGGYHEFEVDTRNLNSGIYFIALISNGSKKTVKLVVSK